MLKNVKILIIAVVLSGCQGNGEKIHKRKYLSTNRIGDVLANLKPYRSSFEIFANQPSVIQSEQGTVIYIPANCFKFKDGKRPTGKIKIVLEECYSNATLIGQGDSSSSFYEFLKSQGMVKIIAKNEGTTLQIIEGDALQIGFPKGNSHEEMDLFYKEDPIGENRMWIPDYRMFEFDPDQKDKYVPYEYWKPMKYPIKSKDIDYSYTISYACNSQIFDKARVKDYGELEDYLADSNGSDSLGKIFFRNAWRVHLDLNINEKGKLCNFSPAEFEFEGVTHTPEAIRLAKEFFGSIPPLDFKYLSGYDRDTKYTLGIMASQDINWNKFKIKFRNKYRKSLVNARNRINHFERDYHVFPVTKLGWLNCAHECKLRNHEMQSFKVFSAEKWPHKIRLIFKNKDGTRTILNGETYKRKTRFYRLPFGQEIEIIGIGVRKGKPIFARYSTRISRRTYQLKNFKEISIDELKYELNKIK